MRRHGPQEGASSKDATNGKRKGRTSLLQSNQAKKHKTITKILLTFSGVVCMYIALSRSSAKKKQRIRQFRQRRNWHATPQGGTQNGPAGDMLRNPSALSDVSRKRHMESRPSKLRRVDIDNNNVARKPNGEVDVESEYKKLEGQAEEWKGKKDSEEDHETQQESEDGSEEEVKTDDETDEEETKGDEIDELSSAGKYLTCI